MYRLTIESKNKDGSDAANNPRVSLVFDTKAKAEQAMMFYKCHAPMENSEAYIEMSIDAVN